MDVILYLIFFHSEDFKTDISAKKQLNTDYYFPSLNLHIPEKVTTFFAYIVLFTQ